MGFVSTSSAVIGGLSTVTVALLYVGFGPLLYTYFIHPAIAVDFSLTKLINGLPDRIIVNNHGNAPANNMLITVSAPQQVHGKILLAPDNNTSVDNGSHCGINCFSVSVPSFSHGGASLELSSLIYNKSNITSGNYTVIASASGISAVFIQPLLQKPHGFQTSIPSPFSSISIFTFPAAIAGIACGVATAYLWYVRHKSRPRQEQLRAEQPKEQPPNPEINIDIERIVRESREKAEFNGTLFGMERLALAAKKNEQFADNPQTRQFYRRVHEWIKGEIKSLEEVREKLKEIRMRP